MASLVLIPATVIDREQQCNAVKDSERNETLGYVPMGEQKETMGERLARLRVMKGWSLAEAAKRFGTSRTAIWKWEHGETTHVRAETLHLVAQAYGTDMAYILWGEDRAPEDPPAGSSPVDRSGRFRKL